MAKRQVSVSIDDELLAYVDQVADRIHRSRSDTIVSMIRQAQHPIEMQYSPLNDFGEHGFPDGGV